MSKVGWHSHAVRLGGFRQPVADCLQKLNPFLRHGERLCLFQGLNLFKNRGPIAHINTRPVGGGLSKEGLLRI